MNRKLFFLIPALYFLADESLAYDSNKVGAAAGRYFGTAVAVDYFFQKSGCKNTRFGMRTSGESAQQFVYKDIQKLLRGSDKREFQGVLTRQFLTSIENTAGESMMTIYKKELASGPSKNAACRDTESIMFGMLTSAITEFYSVAVR